MRVEIGGNRRGQSIIILLLIILLGGCGGSGSESGAENQGGGSDDSSDDSIDDPITLARPEQLIVQSLSATSIEVSWQPSETVEVQAVAIQTEYRIYRDGVLIGSDTDTLFTDIGLSAGQPYSYTVTSFDGENESEASNSDSTKTLVNDENDGLRNGAVITLTNISLRDICGTGSIAAVSLSLIHI